MKEKRPPRNKSFYVLSIVIVLVIVLSMVVSAVSLIR
jgi:hypothetical protein